MKSIRFLLLTVVLGASGPAYAETIDGSGALALAALAGQNSPLLSAAIKEQLVKLLDGNTKIGLLTGQPIVVKIDKLTCKASNVDITLHSCDLMFGTRTTTLIGRAANELFATLAEVGVPSDGAAGSIYEAVTKLNCIIDPNDVKQVSGGGAHCDYTLPEQDGGNWQV
jgi:hypothetical protein